ncbi:hypothetical protein FNV43_RR17453 [Rhamnella rubrinervis]|uniref:Dof zinc finger protein n=1 Tax=Rhamnella rubrinervis TaxID=2594499 RepID=A0A8K0E1Q2_9ROSA|nr:hypothetical protein FNV43_RR17453 [Rhamnella rubrinervis]
MMSPDNIQAKQPGGKDENQGSSSRKTASSTRPPEQALKCPRCDSPNTKFCYYNNYSLTQPRHFCKTCRRYWTKGGALRNVPIGGGCRKNKKVKSSSRLSGSDSKDSSSTSEIGGLKFFHGISPAMDFQLGGLSFPRLHHSNPSSATGIYNQLSSNFGDVSAASNCFTLDNPSGTSNSLMGFNYNPLSLATGSGGGFSGGAIQTNMNSSMNVHSNLASSIESLSSINQDLHWKLQQQRLSMLFGGDKDSGPSSVPVENQQTQKSQSSPILFHNLEVAKPEVCTTRKQVSGGGDTATEWFFGNSYAPPVTPTPANSNSNGGNENATNNNWNGFQAWSDMQQYSALP